MGERKEPTIAEQFEDLREDLRRCFGLPQTLTTAVSTKSQDTPLWGGIEHQDTFSTADKRTGPREELLQSSVSESVTKPNSNLTSGTVNESNDDDGWKTEEEEVFVAGDEIEAFDQEERTVAKVGELDHTDEQRLYYYQNVRMAEVNTKNVTDQEDDNSGSRRTRYSAQESEGPCLHCRRQRRSVSVQTDNVPRLTRQSQSSNTQTDNDPNPRYRSHGTQAQTVLFYLIVPQLTWDFFTGISLKLIPFFWLGII